MEQYISKAAVVAEIERNLRICAIMISQHQDENCVELYKQKADVYQSMHSFLDTLEVREIDNIWHDASEELPVIYCPILLYIEDGTVMQGR